VILRNLCSLAHERPATGTEISWISPIARALLKAEVGDVVDVRTPNGVEPIEVLATEY
jgi:transcription elongation GreA/GreB family factor